MYQDSRAGVKPKKIAAKTLPFLQTVLQTDTLAPAEAKEKPTLSNSQYLITASLILDAVGHPIYSGEVGNRELLKQLTIAHLKRTPKRVRRSPTTALKVLKQVGNDFVSADAYASTETR